MPRESAIVARGMTVEEAAMIRDAHDRGGVRDFIGVRTCPPSLLRAMVARGWIETRQNARGGWELMLTGQAVQALPTALKVLAAEVAAGRR